MNPKAAIFLPANSRVLALPNASRPRLYLTSESVTQRWRHSALYPAFRWTARSYRVALRLKAALGLGRTYLNSSADYALGELLQDCLPGARAAAVSLGTPGPAQKITVQLWKEAQVAGYLKYAESVAAVARLEQEYKVLNALPAGAGPSILKYVGFAKGMVLITSPVTGNAVTACLPLGPRLRGYLNALLLNTSWPLEQHPWIVKMRERFGSTLDEWLEPLTGRTWPAVFHHGDFAPWNVLHTSGGKLAAIDWEYGSAQGFPHLDAAYYLLQVAALMRRWPARRARAYAARHLSADLGHAQADALVRLAAFVAYHEALSDGHESVAPLQMWRRTVWEAE